MLGSGRRRTANRGSDDVQTVPSVTRLVLSAWAKKHQALIQTGALWDLGIAIRRSLYRFTVFGACRNDMVIHKS